MALDFKLPFNVFANNRFTFFNTLKPLCFIAKVETYWVVFTLHEEQFRVFGEHAYYSHRFGSYHKAKVSFKENMSYFISRPRKYGNWPVK